MMALVTEAASGKYHLDLSFIPDFVWFILCFVAVFSISLSLFRYWRSHR